MSKVTKKELLRRIEALEKFAKYADKMLTELNHALPDPEYDAKCEENAVAAEESLARHAVRLGLVKPKLKQLDQSVFDGLDEKWRFAAINVSGALMLSTYPIEAMSGSWVRKRNLGELINYGLGYDTSNWQNSLIERKELTGSDLCRAMLERGDKCVPCDAYDGAEDGKTNNCLSLVTKFKAGMFHCAAGYDWENAVPINTVTGEPLTSSEVGL